MPGSSLGIARSSKRAPRAAVVHQLGQRVRQPAGADVVDRQDRIARRPAPAAVDHLLAAALDLGVVALHRGEVEVLGVGAGAPSTTPRRRPGRSASPGRRARRAACPPAAAASATCARADVAEAAGEHDRLVVAAHLAADRACSKRAEVAGRFGPPELVVERGAAERAVEHDVERARRCGRACRTSRLPRLRERRGCAGCETREADQAGLGLARRARSRLRRGSRRPSRSPRPGTARSRSGGCGSRPSSGCASSSCVARYAPCRRREEARAPSRPRSPRRCRCTRRARAAADAPRACARIISNSDCSAARSPSIDPVGVEDLVPAVLASSPARTSSARRRSGSRPSARKLATR